MVRRRRVAPDLAVLTLAPDRPYPFTAGQYLTLCSPRRPQGLAPVLDRRCPARTTPSTCTSAGSTMGCVRELVARHDWLHVVLAAPADGTDREGAAALLRDGLRRLGDCSGYDIHLSGPSDLAPAVAGQLIGQGAEPEAIRHDPVPPTFNRARPLTPSEWFLDQRDVAWINRTELG